MKEFGFCSVSAMQSWAGNEKILSYLALALIACVSLSQFTSLIICGLFCMDTLFIYLPFLSVICYLGGFKYTTQIGGPYMKKISGW